MSLVEAGVDIVDIFFVQPLSCEAKPLAETLKMDDLSCTQEFDDVAYVRVVGKAQDIVIGHARFLLCCDRVRTTFLIF